ncbi:RDD family protein [Ferruginibacter sp.]
MDHNDTIFTDIQNHEAEVTMIQGFLTRLIDFAIDMGIIFLIYMLIPREAFLNLISLSSFIIPAIVILLIGVYRFLFLMLFNKTIGMMLCKVKFLNKEFKPLSSKEKVLSIFRTRFSSIKYYKEK